MPLALVGGVSFWKGKFAKPSRDWCSYRRQMYTIFGMMTFADDDGRMKARCALTNIRDMVKGSRRARSPIVDSHAPSGPRQLLRRRRDPKGASSKTPPKDRLATRSFAPSEANVLETHAFANNNATPLSRRHRTVNVKLQRISRELFCDTLRVRSSSTPRQPGSTH